MFIPLPDGPRTRNGRTQVSPMKGALLLVIVAAFFATAHQSIAALGGSADSIAADRKAMSAARGKTTVHAGYTVQEVVSDSTTVREYIAPTGIVFGVAWNGIANPNLTQLLGSYSGEYEDAARKAVRKPGRRYSEIKTDRIIVQRWGHMRNLQGRAYATDLIPPGVSIDEIR